MKNKKRMAGELEWKTSVSGQRLAKKTKRITRSRVQLFSFSFFYFLSVFIIKLQAVRKQLNKHCMTLLLLLQKNKPKHHRKVCNSLCFNSFSIVSTVPTLLLQIFVFINSQHC